MERIGNMRKGNYASQVLGNLDDLKEALLAAKANEPYYFSVHINGNATPKVFYMIMRTTSVEGATICDFYKDQTQYVGSGMDGMYENDYIIKTYYSASAPVEEVVDIEIAEIPKSSVKSDMVSYIEVFLDAVQVLAVMPY